MKLFIYFIVFFVFIFSPFIFSMANIAKKSDEISDIAFRNYLRTKMEEKENKSDDK